jgi:UDP-glucose 4-epimerase
MRLAAKPIPLPFGAFSSRRSLLALDNLIAAVSFALEDPRAENETFLVADPEPISVAELVATLREAAGRKPWLVSVPPPLLSGLLGLIGKRDMAERLAGTMIAEPTKLLAAGWCPVTDTRTALAAMTRAGALRQGS